MDEMDALTQQQQADHDDLASAVGAAVTAHQLDLDSLSHGGEDPTTAHHHHHHHSFEHDLKAPDFGTGNGTGDIGEGDVHGGEDLEVDVSQLDIPQLGSGDDDDDVERHYDVGGDTYDKWSKPLSMRKACDLCHMAKQKCSGDKPTCTRCAAGNWECVYGTRARRSLGRKHARAVNMAETRSIQRSTPATPAPKKRKIRESIAYVPAEPVDLKAMARELELAVAEDNEPLVGMSDDQMIESIAIDGYLADLPLATFQHNLPYQPPEPQFDIDQHTTSALRDAIFSLNESHGNTEDVEHHEEGEGMDPHLALLDLSHAMPEAENGEAEESTTCNHAPLVPHVLNLLLQHPLDPKQGSNTPLTLAIFSPLARALRLFHSLINCTHCMSSPHQTLPQLALLSRITTILTYPFPPIGTAAGVPSAHLAIQGGKLFGTGLSEAIETHIVGVVWDSWRAAVREIFASIERRAQEIIAQSAMASSNNTEGTSASRPETQRAGMMFQAMSRLVTAMDEVEGN